MPSLVEAWFALAKVTCLVLQVLTGERPTRTDKPGVSILGVSFVSNERGIAVGLDR